MNGMDAIRKANAGHNLLQVDFDLPVGDDVVSLVMKQASASVLGDVTLRAEKKIAELSKGNNKESDAGFLKSLQENKTIQQKKGGLIYAYLLQETLFEETDNGLRKFLRSERDVEDFYKHINENEKALDAMTKAQDALKVKKDERDKEVEEIAPN